MRIAAIAGKQDVLFLSSNLKGIKIFFILIENAPDYDWLKRIVPKQRQIHIKLSKSLSDANSSDDDLIKRSNLTSILKKFRIDSFMTSHQGSLFLAAWAKKNRLRLLCTDIKDQLKFENKIWFDRFLLREQIPKPKSAIYLGKDIPSLFHSPIVIQSPNSFGSFGTFLIRNSTNLQALKASSAIKKASRYLIREFIEGQTYGITVFIDNSHIVLSACRLQCFHTVNGPKPIFAGVQWVKTDTFSKKARNAINEVFIKLGSALYNKAFFGFANFDFILTPDNDVNVIECNPRLSSATPHLFSCHEVTGNIDCGSLYLGKFTSRREPLVVSVLPDSNFDGALLDIICMKDSTIVSKIHLNGTYKITDATLKFQSPRLPAFSSNKPICLYSSEQSIGMKINYEDTSGSVISNFPLFTQKGKLNSQGKQMLKYFSNY